ncbi:hypothetical protein B566_EDAN002001 [Ephemera danica]|nr:hypothetical protein B566_EDAN002001 [Ephemera danica]
MGLTGADPPWGSFNSNPYQSSTHYLPGSNTSPLQSSGYTPYATDMASLADPTTGTPMGHLPSVLSDHGSSGINSEYVFPSDTRVKSDMDVLTLGPSNQQSVHPSQQHRGPSDPYSPIIMTRYSEPMSNNGGYMHSGTSPTSSPTMLHHSSSTNNSSYMMGMHNNYSSTPSHHSYYPGSGTCSTGSPSTTYLGPPMVQATLLYPHLYNQNQIHLHLHGDSNKSEVYPTTPPHDEVTIVTSTSNITISGSRAIETQPPPHVDEGATPDAHDARYSVSDRQTDPSVWRPY